MPRRKEKRRPRKVTTTAAQTARTAPFSSSPFLKYSTSSDSSRAPRQTGKSSSAGRAPAGTPLHGPQAGGLTAEQRGHRANRGRNAPTTMPAALHDHLQHQVSLCGSFAHPAEPRQPVRCLQRHGPEDRTRRRSQAACPRPAAVHGGRTRSAAGSVVPGRLIRSPTGPPAARRAYSLSREPSAAWPVRVVRTAA